MFLSSPLPYAVPYHIIPYHTTPHHTTPCNAVREANPREPPPLHSEASSPTHHTQQMQHMHHTVFIVTVSPLLPCRLLPLHLALQPPPLALGAAIVHHPLRLLKRPGVLRRGQLLLEHHLVQLGGVIRHLLFIYIYKQFALCDAERVATVVNNFYNSESARLESPTKLLVGLIVSW